jgi:hypothetical protein
MDSRQDTPKGGLPHSEISGSPGARPSPELFAACHVLHRLSVPRHPPDALVVLAHAQPQGRARRRCRRQMSEVRCQMSEGIGPLRPAHRCIQHPTPDRLSRSRCVSIAPTGATCPGVSAYPCPGTTGRPHATRRSRRLVLSCPLHGHDSLHDVKTSPRPAPAPAGTTRADLLSGRLQEMSSWIATHACWWAWADSNGRPHAYQACALTS